MTAVAPARHRLFDPSTYRATYLRAVRAEIGKAAQSRGFWITSAIAIALAAGIGTLIAKLGEPTSYEASTVGMLWSFFALFIVPLAVVMATSEYAHNTMRTTVLATPRRPVAYAAKLTAVLVFCGTLAACIIAADFLAEYSLSSIATLGEHAVRSLVMTWVVLTTLALGAMGLAYLLRSTAGSIVLIIAVLNFASLLTFIPNETLQKHILPYLPDAVGNAALRTTELDASTAVDWPLGAILWVCYMAALVCAGLYRFARSDI